MAISKEILINQKQGVMDFVFDNSLGSIPVTFIKGNPDFALAEAVKTNNESLLVLGACKRSNVSKYWIGSTVDSLLQSPPCDLFLIADN